MHLLELALTPPQAHMHALPSRPPLSNRKALVCMIHTQVCACLHTQVCAHTCSACSPSPTALGKMMPLCSWHPSALLKTSNALMCVHTHLPCLLFSSLTHSSRQDASPVFLAPKCPVENHQCAHGMQRGEGVQAGCHALRRI